MAAEQQLGGEQRPIGRAQEENVVRHGLKPARDGKSNQCYAPPLPRAIQPAHSPSAACCIAIGAWLLGGDRARLGRFFFRQLFLRRIETTLENTVEPVEIGIDYRGDIERQQLGDAKPTDHRDTERLTQLGTCAGTERNRQRAGKWRRKLSS
jgi:hypothetical protein